MKSSYKYWEILRERKFPRTHRWDISKSCQTNTKRSKWRWL